ncbi:MULTISPECIES: HAMP domain-containing sensor histidine kinase [Mucilaginibacter]|uniref:HAMP domain-containing sensor histidine kinase n=1 Tax=Mucilaginibacter TaxID=423349 RepID=UPI0008711C19|nr:MULTISPECIES: ATP-binding protein [Mucilaginibacter]NVM62427.1 PAS domain S-box-containing protein [Mucilaginibacter sp. SG538B]SCW73716.1 PAS domain S-box-containing protein [Mucilaginibacter sp. NFR10]
MTIKNKLRAGIGFLFVLAIICCGMSIYFLNRLSADAGAILKDNYKTVKYMQNILTAIDSRTDKLSADQQKTINDNLVLQEHNITEVGELQLTDSLRAIFERLTQEPDNKITEDDLRNRLHRQVYGIMKLNMDAIARKNEIANTTSKRGSLLVAFLGAFLFLVAFSFAVNFPGYIANPIKELTVRIKEVSNKNYHQQIHFESDDEFGELGQAFNNMTRKLDEFENSNLASILFEKKRIETIINSMHDAIIGLDEKGVIIFANQVACNLIGMKPDQLNGKYAPDIAIENDLMRKLLVNDQAKLRIFADEREGFYSRESLSVSSRDKVIGKVIILKNITEYQQLDEAKTNFIATISHELKTPISSIKMSLKLLEDERIGEVNAEQRQLIGNIEDDTRRLLLITGELLDMAQVETGKLQLNFGSTHPQNIVDYAVKAIKFIADQKHVEIKVKCDQSLPKVHADLDKTTWVLINLLSNAIKYSHEKSTVELVVKKHKNDEIEFSVTDHGKGIEQQYLPRLFERYFKVPNATSEQSGTGLGLAIAKDFIEAQAGKISVDSEIGSGSTFYFTLKRAIAAA